MVLEVYRLYRLDRYPEVARYHLYRHTYFAGANAGVRAAFDKLLKRMSEDLQRPAVNGRSCPDCRRFWRTKRIAGSFARMVSPVWPGAAGLTSGWSEGRGPSGWSSNRPSRTPGAAPMRSGETFDPAEIGASIASFSKRTIPNRFPSRTVTMSFAIRERVVGGLCFRLMFKHAAYIDGIVVAPELKGLGLGGTMVDDFCQRMAGSGLNLVLTTIPSGFLHS